MAGTTIYCEGKSGSHDYDILSQVIDGLNVTIQPIGGKRGANAIIEFVEIGSGELPKKLDLNNCKSEAWKLIENAKTSANWTQEIFQTTLQKYLDKFDDKFFNDLHFLIYFQGKDFAKALTNKLREFPLKNYYRYAKDDFDYTKFKDLVELRKIICK
ncbi:hypothetical protein AGMMS49965_03210 [Bacteroidia bacterium]|nr:hypothetical protein AGMMS49965_03210 [Bacteroidia bacterium]